MRVYLHTLGCRLNQAEIERMARQYAAAGHDVVADAADADVCVVNTCAVTGEAARKSRQLVRHLHRANPALSIIVTGCYAQLEPEAVARLPGVLQVVPNAEKDDIAPQPDNARPDEALPTSGTAGRTRAFVKVQDGCNNRCTFCVTTIARGASRSRPLSAVVAEIDALAGAGYKEVVLTGVHLGAYGRDLGTDLFTLVRAVLDGTAIPRLRLSSLEPWDLAPGFFDLWQDGRLCRQLHLPLQSGAARTLRRMARRTTPAAYAALVESARARIPDLALTTDVIVGFPGETDAEFEESLAFARAMDFAKLHVFRYSPREGTAAASMSPQIDEATKRARSAQIQALSDEGGRRFAARFVGRVMSVLWEADAGARGRVWRNTGLTDNYLRVWLDAPRVLTNTITSVRLAGVCDGGLRGELVGASP